jgi:DNA-directed RNA polymerase subunit M/transcription elongation factor TFIIS
VRLQFLGRRITARPASSAETEPASSEALIYNQKATRWCACDGANCASLSRRRGSGASESFLGGFRAEVRQVLLRGIPCPARAIPPSFAPASRWEFIKVAKIAKTGDRKKVMDTSKSTNCPKCGKPTRIVKRVKDRERNVPGGVFISCSACEFYEKL